MNTVVFGTSYLGSIEYYASLVKNKAVIIDQHEWFVKQSIRNRCIISAPNGIQKLIVPYSHFGAEKIRVKDLQVNYTKSWHKYQLKCLNTAYNSSPFYEFYKDKLSAILLCEPKFLIDLNIQIMHFVLQSLQVELDVTLSTEYIENADDDYRNLSTVKDNSLKQSNYIPQEYPQVFSHKHGFIANLSIIDLLANQGPNSVSYL